MYNKKTIVEALRNLNKPRKVSNNNSTNLNSKSNNTIHPKNGIDTPVYKNISIKPSNIDGNGLFAEEPISKGDIIGVSHVRKKFMKDGEEYTAPIPSKLVGYYNHHDIPNVTEVDMGDHILMKAIRNISPNQEIVSNYDQTTVPDLESTSDFKYKKGGSKRPSLPSKKSPRSYSRSFEATNRLFAQHPLFKKPKSRKNKIFDPRAQYYAEGGEPCPSGYIRDENGNCVWHDPDQENLSINTSPVHPVEYLRSQLTMGDPFYNTHEVYPSDEGDIRWQPKANIEANLRNTNLKKFIQRHPEQSIGLELGYLHNNIWTSPTLGLELDITEPGYAPNQLGFERDGEHPNVYFIKNPVEGSAEAPSGTYPKAFQEYNSRNLSKNNDYNRVSNELGRKLLEQGYKGENMWGKDDPEQLYQLYGTEGLTLKGATKITPETLKYLESIKDSEEGKRYLAKMAGISEDDPDYANMLMHYNTTPIDVYAKSSRPDHADIPKAKLEQDNNMQTTFLTNTEGPVNYKRGGLTQYAPGGYSDEPPGSKKKNYGDSKRILPRWMPERMVKAIQNTEIGVSPLMSNEQAYPIGMKKNFTDIASGKESLLGEGIGPMGISNPAYGINFTTGLTRDVSKPKGSGWALKGYLGRSYDPSLGQAAGAAIERMGQDTYDARWDEYYEDLAAYNAGTMPLSVINGGWTPESAKPKYDGKLMRGLGKAIQKSPLIGGLSAHYRYDKFKQPHGYKAAGEGEIKLDWDPSNNIGLGLKGGLEFYGGDKYYSKNYRPGSYKWNVSPSVTAGLSTRPHFGFNLNAGIEGLPKFMPKNFPGYFYGDVNYNQSLLGPGSLSANAGMKFPLNDLKQRRAKKRVQEKEEQDRIIPNTTSPGGVRNTTYGSQKNGGLVEYAPGGATDWPPKWLTDNRAKVFVNPLYNNNWSGFTGKMKNINNNTYAQNPIITPNGALAVGWEGGPRDQDRLKGRGWGFGALVGMPYSSILDGSFVPSAALKANYRNYVKQGGNDNMSSPYVGADFGLDFNKIDGLNASFRAGPRWIFGSDRPQKGGLSADIQPYGGVAAGLGKVKHIYGEDALANYQDDELDDIEGTGGLIYGLRGNLRYKPKAKWFNRLSPTGTFNLGWDIKADPLRGKNMEPQDQVGDQWLMGDVNTKSDKVKWSYIPNLEFKYSQDASRFLDKKSKSKQRVEKLKAQDQEDPGYNPGIRTSNKLTKKQLEERLSGPKEEQDGGFIIDLTDADIQRYVDGGYIVEELPKANGGRIAREKKVTNTSNELNTVYDYFQKNPKLAPYIIEPSFKIANTIAPSLVKDMAYRAMLASHGTGNFQLSELLNIIKRDGNLKVRNIDENYGYHGKSLTADPPLKGSVAESIIYGPNNRSLTKEYLYGEGKGFEEAEYDFSSDPGLSAAIKEYGPLKAYLLNSKIINNEPLSVDNFRPYQIMYKKGLMTDKLRSLEYELKNKESQGEKNVSDLKREILNELFNASKSDQINIEFNPHDPFKFGGVDFNYEIGNPIHPYDDITGHMGFLKRLPNQEFEFTTRDLWGFNPKAYTKKWLTEGDNSTYFETLPVRMLSKVGKPFILHQTNPIKFKDGGLPKAFNGKGVKTNKTVTEKETKSNIEKENVEKLKYDNLVEQIQNSPTQPTQQYHISNVNIPSVEIPKPEEFIIDNNIKNINIESIPSTEELFKEGSDSFIMQQILEGNVEPNLMAQMVERSITPIGYGAASKLIGIPGHLMFGKYKPVSYELKNRYDAWSVYNGLQPKHDSFIMNSDGTLAIKQFDVPKRVLDSIRDSEKTSFETAEFNESLNDGYPLNFGGVHGNGYVVKGVDANGRMYMDFTDKWDLQPFESKTYFPNFLRNFEVSQLSGGKPFQLRNRIYFDNEGNYFDHNGVKLIQQDKTVKKNYSSALKQVLTSNNNQNQPEIEWEKKEPFMATSDITKNDFDASWTDWGKAQGRESMIGFVPWGIGAMSALGLGVYKNYQMEQEELRRRNKFYFDEQERQLKNQMNIINEESKKYSEGGEYELGDEVNLTKEQVAELKRRGYTLEEI